jgi:hypothetical protein
MMHIASQSLPRPGGICQRPNRTKGSAHPKRSDGTTPACFVSGNCLWLPAEQPSRKCRSGPGLRAQGAAIATARARKGRGVMERSRWSASDYGRRRPTACRSAADPNVEIRIGQRPMAADTSTSLRHHDHLGCIGLPVTFPPEAMVAGRCPRLRPGSREAEGAALHSACIRSGSLLLRGFGNEASKEG